MHVRKHVPAQDFVQVMSEEGREAYMLWCGKLSGETGEYLLETHDISCDTAPRLAKGSVDCGWLDMPPQVPPLTLLMGALTLSSLLPDDLASQTSHMPILDGVLLHMTLR